MIESMRHRASGVWHDRALENSDSHVTAERCMSECFVDDFVVYRIIVSRWLQRIHFYS